MQKSVFAHYQSVKKYRSPCFSRFFLLVQTGQIIRNRRMISWQERQNSILALLCVEVLGLLSWILVLWRGRCLPPYGKEAEKGEEKGEAWPPDTTT